MYCCVLSQYCSRRSNCLTCNCGQSSASLLKYCTDLSGRNWTPVKVFQGCAPLPRPPPLQLAVHTGTVQYSTVQYRTADFPIEACTQITLVDSRLSSEFSSLPASLSLINERGSRCAYRYIFACCCNNTCIIVEHPSETADCWRRRIYKGKQIEVIISHLRR